MYKNIKFYVDIQKDDIGYIKSGEITTDNRFAALADHNIETRKPQERSGRSCPDYDHSEERKPFIFDDLSNFISIIDDLSSKDYKMNNYIMFVNNNKNSLSTGYYPDIIYLESDNFSILMALTIKTTLLCIMANQLDKCLILTVDIIMNIT